MRLAGVTHRRAVDPVHAEELDGHAAVKDEAARGADVLVDRPADWALLWRDLVVLPVYGAVVERTRRG